MTGERLPCDVGVSTVGVVGASGDCDVDYGRISGYRDRDFGVAAFSCLTSAPRVPFLRLTAGGANAHRNPRWAHCVQAVVDDNDDEEESPPSTVAAPLHLTLRNRQLPQATLVRALRGG